MPAALVPPPLWCPLPSKKWRRARAVIGGVTVDSIRLEPAIKEGAVLRRGALMGSFARGGSSIAIFFNRKVALVEECAALHAQGLDFKIDAGAGLAHLC